MKPNREAADAILAILGEASEIHAKQGQLESAVYWLGPGRQKLINLAAQLIPYNESYGHAERLHKLTGGSDNGND